MRGLPAQVPVELDGPAARELARQELAKQAYVEQQPGLLQRAWDATTDFFDRLLSGTDGGGGGSIWRLLLLVLVLAVVVALIVYQAGGLRGSARGGRALLEGPVLTAAFHRGEADRHAQAGRWAEAVRERLRAVVRSLEERGVLEPRPGRTADEVAADAGGALPELAEQLQRAAGVFDEIWYGGREAGEQAYATVAGVDDAVSARLGQPA